ncbi:MAG: ankyrin repeat domain-containing protein [Planctomycetota bacterium]
MSTADLFAYAKNGDIAAAQSLLSADPNSANDRDQRGATPLHYAAIHGNREIASLLIRHGADVNSRDAEFGATPTGWAIEHFREMGGLLGIEIDDMAYAIECDDAKWVKRMIDRFPALRDAVTSEGVTLRELAVKCSSGEIRAIFNHSTSE